MATVPTTWEAAGHPIDPSGPLTLGCARAARAQRARVTYPAEKTMIGQGRP